MTSGPSDEADRKAYEQRSWAELEAGRLPLRAQERLASMQADHAFTSDLTTAEHHAVRSVGFVPVGQVMGASVFQVGYRARTTALGSCQARRAPVTRGATWPAGLAPIPPLQISNVDAAPWRTGLLGLRHRARHRLEQEALALGADGVVGVRVEQRQLGEHVQELLMVGTAVRASRSRLPPDGVFSCALSGQDFAKALRAGQVPVRLVFGVAAMLRHDQWTTRDSWRSNVELTGFTTLATAVRADARRRLLREVTDSGATSFVLAGHDSQVVDRECAFGGTDHAMAATFYGTAMAETADVPADAARAVLRLRDADAPRELALTGLRS